MKFKTCLIFLFIALALPANTTAGDLTSNEEMATKLSSELFEVQAKEVELQIRLQQLDDDLKPVNIERALAGIVSTKPEDLREHRRRLLTIERDGVLAQLKLLAKSRERLEAAIAAAEAAAYQQSARTSLVSANQPKLISGWLWVSPTARTCRVNDNRDNEPDLGRQLSSGGCE
jgi:hypothetical protein